MLEAEYEKEREKIEGKEDDRLKAERIQTLQTIFQRAWRYQERGMLEEIILGFVQKKTAMLQNARTKGELQEISNRLNRFITEMSLPPESMTQRKKNCWSGALLVCKHRSTTRHMNGTKSCSAAVAGKGEDIIPGNE